MPSRPPATVVCYTFRSDTMEMKSKAVIEHPEHGQLLSQQAAARYLGVSVGTFRRLAPGPDGLVDGFRPYWSRRVLDIFPLAVDFDRIDVTRRGKACGCDLFGKLGCRPRPGTLPVSRSELSRGPVARWVRFAIMAG